jgi:hypothetical protein
MIDGGKPLRKVQTQDVSFVLDYTAAAIDDTTGFSQKKPDDSLGLRLRPERRFLSVVGNMQQVSNVPLNG